MPMMQFSVAPWRVLNRGNLHICREAALLHQKFSNEILELAKKSAKSGEPIVRSMEYMYPHQGYEKINDQFMLGDNILVAPVVVKNQVTRMVEFPEGQWRGDDASVVTGPIRKEIKTPLNRLPWFKKVTSE